MAYREEEAVYGQVVSFLVRLAHALHQVYSLHAVFAIKPYGVVLEKYLYLGVFGYSALHGVTGAQEGFPHYHVYLGAETGQVGGLFASRVASAHYGHHFLAVEESVTGGAGAHALAHVFALVVESEILGRGSRGDDDGLCLYLFPSVCGQEVGRLGEVHLGNLSVAQVYAEAGGLFPQVHHHLVAVHAQWVAGEVVHHGGLRQLAARLQAAILHGAQIGPAGVDGRGVSGGSAAYDDASVIFLGHGYSFKSSSMSCSMRSNFSVGS